MPTTAVMPFAESMVNDLAMPLPNLTCVAPVKFSPVIFIVVPFEPVAGVKENTLGAAYTKPPRESFP